MAGKIGSFASCMSIYPMFTRKRAGTAIYWYAGFYSRSTLDVSAAAAAADITVYLTHAEVYVGVEDLGHELHRRRNHGVLLPHGDLELVNPCRDGRKKTKV